MNLNEYTKKIKGCFCGKNIGGTLGAPFECKRGIWDLEFYTTDMSTGVLPNDDLDLQLVWLNVVEKYGRYTNSHILSNYWINNVVGNWSEYGAAKNNLRAGLLPGISGAYKNHNKDSCGAFIRSEIWACLAPGHPEIAVKYAYEDAIVDHADEGVYAEIFTAAVEAAAFFIDSAEELIKIGLSYIPETSSVYGAVSLVCDCFREKKTWKETRSELLTKYPCSFGMYDGYEDRIDEKLPEGELGFDAPANIGIIIIGWLYGKGDFGQSICIAAGCGEDSDCTAATLGSILGIIMGIDKIPDKWKEPIGNEIKTISIDLTDEKVNIPATVDDLCIRILKIMPEFMREFFDVETAVLTCADKSDMYCNMEKIGVYTYINFKDRWKEEGLRTYFENSLLGVAVIYCDGIDVDSTLKKRIKIHIENKCMRQQWLTLRWIVPVNIEINSGKESSVVLDQYHGGYGYIDIIEDVLFSEMAKSKYNIMLEISICGYAERLYIPIVFISV